MNDNEIKRPDPIPATNQEKQDVKLIIDKIVELIRIKHL
jgi:hypothetical protein